jgi:hypothetical protein
MILCSKSANEGATLRIGDTIYMHEKFIAKFRKYVPYSVIAGNYLQEGYVSQ